MMTAVSRKEFNTHQDRYFEIAINEQVYVQNGEYTFIVKRADEPKRKHKKPDEKLRRAVTMDVVKERLQTHIHKLFTEK